MVNLQSLEVHCDVCTIVPTNRLSVHVFEGPRALQLREAQRQERDRLKKEKAELEFNGAADRGAEFFEKHICERVVAAATDMVLLARLDSHAVEILCSEYEATLNSDVNPKGFRSGVVKAAKSVKAKLMKERYARKK
jgi:hypothetical protein